MEPADKAKEKANEGQPYKPSPDPCKGNHKVSNLSPPEIRMQPHKGDSQGRGNSEKQPPLHYKSDHIMWDRKL